MENGWAGGVILARGNATGSLLLKQALLVGLLDGTEEPEQEQLQLPSQLVQPRLTGKRPVGWCACCCCGSAVGFSGGTAWCDHGGLQDMRNCMHVCAVAKQHGMKLLVIQLRLKGGVHAGCWHSATRTWSW